LAFSQDKDNPADHAIQDNDDEPEETEGQGLLRTNLD